MLSTFIDLSTVSLINVIRRKFQFWAMEVPEPRVRKRPLSKMAFSSLSVGWLVGGCGARAASRKTSITFILYKNIIFSPFRIFFRKSLSDFLLRGWGVLPLSAKGIFKGKGKVRVPP